MQFDTDRFSHTKHANHWILLVFFFDQFPLVVQVYVTMSETLQNQKWPLWDQTTLSVMAPLPVNQAYQKGDISATHS